MHPPAHRATGRAVTIATRYCAVRRQTATKLGEPEVQVRRAGGGCGWLGLAEAGWACSMQYAGAV